MYAGNLMNMSQLIVLYTTILNILENHSQSYLMVAMQSHILWAPHIAIGEKHISGIPKLSSFKEIVT